MMCRVTAPLAELIRREAASHPRSLTSSLLRRLRISRRRALRWFGEPIAVVERERREHELDPSIWGYGFLSRPGRSIAYRAAKRVA